jgi:hypothetical protein
MNDGMAAGEAAGEFDSDRAARKRARRARRDARRVPVAARVLGALGLAPSVLIILARLTTDVDSPITGLLMTLGVAYSLMILSFLGGIWWGIACTRAGDERQTSMLAIAVAPTIIALVLFVFAQAYPVIATAVLALCIAGTLLVDRKLLEWDLVPIWWMRLRMPLSLALGALTLVLAGMLML